MLLPDEVHVDIEQFNRQVHTENFNRVVCGGRDTIAVRERTAPA